MKAIIITGTPGTGKTTLAIELVNRYKFKYIDVNSVVLEHNLSEGFDNKRMCEIIDTDKLNKVLIELINKSVKRLVIDSHLSHSLPPEYVDLCIVTKCNLRKLKNRLKKKGFSDKKVRENLDAEIFDICLIEAKDAGHLVYIVETDKEIDYDSILRKI